LPIGLCLQILDLPLFAGGQLLLNPFWASSKLVFPSIFLAQLRRLSPSPETDESRDPRHRPEA
jgi:hypothetical protein